MERTLLGRFGRVWVLGVVLDSLARFCGAGTALGDDQNSPDPFFALLCPLYFHERHRMDSLAGRVM